MAIPDYQLLMLPVLRAASNGEVRISSVVEELAAQLNLTADELAALLPSGKQSVFSNRVHWAKSYLNKANLVESTRRGHFRITPRGEDLLASQPSTIDNKLLMQFEEFRQFRDRSDEGGDVPAQLVAPLSTSEDPKQTPDEVIRFAYKQIEAALGQDLLERIKQAPPEFFERLIITLLLSMGYGGSTENAGRTLGQSGDDGVYIQAKRYALGNNIGPGAIRDFFGSLDRHKAAKDCSSPHRRSLRRQGKQPSF
jgi:restriction system protein